MCCRGSTSSRFLQKYYVINFLIIISYLFIRIFGQKDYIYGLTSAEGWTGLPRELEISVSVLIVCISRYRNAKTIDQTLSVIFLLY